MSRFEPESTHSLILGYVIWLFGFTGAHRFYYGRPVSGTVWFFTLGLLGVGWLVDLFLIPAMNQSCVWKYEPGEMNYSIAWLLLSWAGWFGVHRLYIGKIGSGLAELVMMLLIIGSGGFLGLFFGLPLLIIQLIDLWTLNEQISEANIRQRLQH
ncbi:MAG: NINE protein [Planctomycetota bacterium]|jgi:TM2 domain-containing membrane protein YozV